MKRRILIAQLFLIVAFVVNAKDYQAGEIQSKTSFHYGRFETRFYSSDVSGTLSTFFLFENDGWKETDIWQEIDVEVFGKSPQNIWQSNVIYETNVAGPTHHSEETHSLGADSVNNWHTYTVDWTPDYIEWFVDGESIRTLTDQAILDIIGAKPMLAMFNCWAHESTAWVGTFDIDALPAYQFVDYIKVYDWVDGTNFETATSFEDNFDGTLSQWNTSTHTFEGNLCDFSTRNVGVKEGYLVLSVSKATQTTVIADAVIPTDNVTSGIADDSPEHPTLYPNPTSNTITLEQTTQWTLYTSTGVNILNGENSVIDLSQLPAGIYTLTYYKGEQLISEQIVKE